MDYMYAFRQAQRDRLEDAGVVQYPRENSFIRPRRANRAYGLRALVLALTSLFTR